MSESNGEGSGALERRPGADIAQSLTQHETAVLAQIGVIGLPTTGVLVPIEERRRLFSNLEDALSSLDAEGRARSLYLSKFVMAVAAGLFDAALNYLWDETIRELRRRVVNYDLAYFFDIAVTSPDRRKKLQGADDLPMVDDSELMRATNTMGLVSDVGYKQLELVRYMRNFASAAHPNQNELTGLQLTGFLETCIREVITLPESNVVAEVRKLLANIKSTNMTPAEAKATSTFFTDLPLAQADNLGQGLFGIYVDPTSSVQTQDNVRLLMPELWPHISVDLKRGFGVRYGRFVANHDQQQADQAREILDLVGAQSYLPESVRVSDLDAAIDTLRSAHDAMNNFYTEPGLARSLRTLVGTDPVPVAVQKKYALTVVNVFLGRGSGIAWNADPVYRELIMGFSPAEAREALLSFREVEVAGKLQMTGPAAKYAEMLELLKPKFSDAASRELLEKELAFTGPRDSMRLDSELKRLAAAV
ncbi:MAG: hypothetical protein KDB63_03465 [Nocardioidaceae bacterium]|nr:hypothetical protein [Nocardioidaceae bacterium]